MTSMIASAGLGLLIGYLLGRARSKTKTEDND